MNIKLTKHIPVTYEMDVVVVGGGLSGVVAAIAAGRNNARVILIERNGVVGGVATVGLMTGMGNRFLTSSGKLVVKGIPLEVVNRLVDEGGTSLYWKSVYVSKIVFDPEILINIFFKMLKESNVNVLLHTMLEDIVIKHGNISHLVILNKSGRQAIKTKVVLDATGEGDVIRLSGAPYEKIDKQMSTLMFKIADVNLEKLCEYLKKNPEEMPPWRYGDVPYDSKITADTWRKTGILCTAHARMFKKAIKKAVKNKDLRINQFPYSVLRYCCLDSFSMQKQGWVIVNAANVKSGYGDTVNTLRITRQKIDLREICYQIHRFFKKYVPGFEKSYIVSIATDMGIRRSLRVKGQYTISVKDRGYFRKFYDVVGTQSQIKRKESQIPYRSLLPRKIKNLIVASGKTISTEKIGMHRNEVECMVIGQAAGTAGALAAKHNVMPKDINIRELQKTLLKQGVYLGDENRLKELKLLKDKKEEKM